MSKRKKKAAAAPATPRKKRKRAPAKRKAPKRKAPKRRKRSSAPRRRSGGSKPGRGLKFEVQRIKLDRRGYDARGRYHGRAPGMKLFQVRVIDKATDVYTDATVSARTMAEAKASVMASMMRSLSSSSGEHRPRPAPRPYNGPPPNRQSLGFNTVRPDLGETFAGNNDLGSELQRVTRAARAASEAGDYREAARLGAEAERLYAQYARGVH